MKKEIRIVAWDDCSFKRNSKIVRIIGVVFRGGQFIDGLISTQIKKDGTDATEKISEAINKSKHYDQLQYIMLDGISFGGFNLVDIKKLYKNTSLPVIVVQRDEPNIKLFKDTIKKLFKDYRKRIKIVNNAGKLEKFGKIYYQHVGLSKKECKDVLRTSTTRSDVPEPIRVAHIIASGLSGENKGRA